MGFHSVPVDIFELVFLRLDSPICLVRASSTCKLWRQIIAGAAFLQRFRSLHEPQVVGSYHNNQLLPDRPRFEPSPFPTIKSSYPSLDFLPVNSTSCTWRIKHGCGSLLLLDYREGSRHMDMFICEPLNRRYEKIPPLTASAPQNDQTDVFLLNGAEPGDTGISNFRLFYLSMRASVAGIFTSGGSWRKLSIDHIHGMEYMGFAAGSLYYYSCTRAVYVLDQGATEFSLSLLPDAEDFDEPIVIFNLAVTTGRDGKARILFLVLGDNLEILARQKGCDWVPKRSIQLSAAMFGVPSYRQCSLIRSRPFCIRQTVSTVRISVSTDRKDGWSMFRLDIETKQLERTTNSAAGYPIKLPWPPSLQGTDRA